MLVLEGTANYVKQESAQEAAAEYTKAKAKLMRKSRLARSVPRDKRHQHRDLGLEHVMITRECILMKNTKVLEIIVFLAKKKTFYDSSNHSQPK